MNHSVLIHKYIHERNETRLLADHFPGFAFQVCKKNVNQTVLDLVLAERSGWAAPNKAP